MSRLAKVKAFSGQAGGASEAIRNPRVLLSRPLYLQPSGKPLPDHERWEWPREGAEETSQKDFKKYGATKNLVVLGGFQFIVEMGLVPSWYCDDQTRREAKKLIKDRNWEDLLEELQGKENSSDDLFGQNALHEFFAYSPPVERNEDGDTRRRAKSKSPAGIGEERLLMRKRHTLRLRKAIEFIVLTEAILAYRFSKHRSLKRFARVTGLPESQAYAEVAWDYLWIEPAFYCISAPPRPEDVKAIMARKELTTRFLEESGQKPGALYFVLKGAPGKHRTIAAACSICNEVYTGLTKAAPRTILPHEYKERMKVFEEKTKIDYRAQMEFAPEMGPIPAPE